MRRTPTTVLAALALAAASVACTTTKPRSAPTPTPSGSQAPTPDATSATPTDTATPTPAGTGPRTDEYDVVYAAGVSLAAGRAAVARAGGEVVHENGAVGVVSVMAGPGFLTNARKQPAIYGAVANPGNDQPTAGHERP